MMRLIYRLLNGLWAGRLITQHRFESIASSPEALRKVRWERANTIDHVGSPRGET